MTMTFRFAAATVLLALLFVLLTALLFGSVGIDEASYHQTLQALDGYGRAESALRRDALLVRAGLLRNYDPLVADVNAIGDDLAALRKRMREQDLDLTPVDALAAAAARQQAATEDFKTRQAQLRNSLAYFPLLAAQALASGASPGYEAAVEALRDSVLRLILDASPLAAQATGARLDTLESQEAPPGAGADTQLMLLRHGRLLQRLLPEVDGTLHTIVSVPNPALDAAVLNETNGRELLLQARARRFRLALYAISIALLIALVRLCLHLRANRLALEERAEIETTVARISTRFVACEPEAIIACFDEALAAIGERTGLDRVYIVLSDPPRTHLWRRDPAAEPAGAIAGWPGAALALLALPVSGDSGLRRATTRRLPDGEARQHLAASGVREWAGFPLALDGRPVGLLGLDIVARGTRWPRSGVEPLSAVARTIESGLARERAGEERDALQARLREAQRMETAGTLASGFAHNFNNIIAAVLGHAEMAAERLAAKTTPDEHLSAGHLEEIRRAGERARDLVARMLQFGRGRAARVPVSLAALAAESVSLLRVSLPPDVELILETDTSDAFVLGEPAQLQQVIINLVSNAVQAIDGPGGTVRLQLARAAVARPRALSLGRIADGEHVRLSVNDTGRGMNPATLHRIFEPFFTTRSAGTGLGLATVADIVRDHGGAIEVSSTPGVGSIFNVWLPRNVVAPPLNETRRGRGEIVAVIEPDAEQLLKTEDMLAALGYEPVGFRHHEAAIAALKQKPGGFDTVLVAAERLDAAQPQLIEQLLLLDPALSVVMIGKADAVSRLGRAQQGRVETVAGPYTLAGVAAALSRCLEHRELHPIRQS